MITSESELISQAIARLQENTPKIKRCLDELTEEEIWQKPNPSSNSVGNLILHLCGNITQYILSSLGGVEDKRERDREFLVDGGLNKKELIEKLTLTVNDAALVIRRLDKEDLLRIRSVQGYNLSAIGIIIHVVEHYSYHTGQIIFWTKLLKDKDLGFYANIDLNKKNVI
ncbi:MAG TPA: DinB family protein [Cyclobacteriaceae bacterium]|nr:DinB family protein [Cyclobacteriaceae bacterium]